MRPFPSVRRWPRWLRLGAVAALLLAAWVPILHRWFRGPSGVPVHDARSWEWAVAAPEEQGLDPERMAELVRIIREGNRYPRLHALLIVRHGRLVVEEYFNRWPADRLHTMQSVSKSFTSALVGIALSRGEMKSLDEPVLSYFPEESGIAAEDERKGAIRLRDVLTMRTGVDYDEHGWFSPHARLNLLPWGRDAYYLRRPMRAQPGTEFRYDSGGVVLLSSMLKARTGMNADAYAERFLFGPLGIARRRWQGNLAGQTHTGGGLYLTARDAARLGQLYLQHGRWDGTQVVPEDWVRESFERQVEFDAQGPGVVGYGYLWWVLSPDPMGGGHEDIHAAIGRYAQYLFVVPEHDLVVVVLGGTRTGPEQGRPVELLYDSILPAVRRRGRG